MGAVAVGTACWVPMADRPPWWPRPTSSGPPVLRGRVLRWHRDRRGRRAPVAHGHGAFAGSHSRPRGITGTAPGTSGLSPPCGRRGEIADTLRTATREARLNHWSGQTKPLDLPARDLLLPPYVLGAWLGDGTLAGGAVTTADAEMVMRLEAEGLVVTPTAAPMRYSLTLPVEAVSGRQCGGLWRAVHAAHQTR